MRIAELYFAIQQNSLAVAILTILVAIAAVAVVLLVSPALGIAVAAGGFVWIVWWIGRHPRP